MNFQKVAIIGAGNVGSAAAYAMAIKNTAAEIMLIDVNEEKEKGEVMDIADGLCFMETGNIRGANFAEAAEADVIVVTAGNRQKPDETRLDLVGKNKEIMSSIFKQIGKIKDTTIVLVVSNPVDILTHHIQNITNLPHSQVFGSGTTLDTARLKTKLAKKFGVSPQSVHGYVMGEHGDSEFVAWSTVTVGGVAINNLPGFNAKFAKQIETSVSKEVYQIIERKGASYYGIGLVITDIVESILYNQHRIIPVTGRLNKYHGQNNVCLGAPAVIGRSGIEKHWPVKLTDNEKKKLATSAKVIKKYL